MKKLTLYDWPYNKELGKSWWTEDKPEVAKVLLDYKSVVQEESMASAEQVARWFTTPNFRALKEALEEIVKHTVDLKENFRKAVWETFEKASS